MKLIDIRSGFETSIGKALPDFRRFNARVTKILESELPCVNLFFQKDRLVDKKNFHENRSVVFEIEIAFRAPADPEAELLALRKRIEDAIEGNEPLRNIVTDLTEEDVDAAHEMVGTSRIAALAMSWRVEYIRPHWLREDSANG